ncbi:TPA: hypothetical protein N0F65_007979 [Lagenidium giganteum]|uniref:PX domain-containing protein n=1 Tax=Lagenidium giganteum TaxID=4803 RepID=A0AAV2YG07_9STRA|nr:TPA: hypothetical protein N0F65_007979 [Lagenidium giganteum]
MTVKNFGVAARALHPVSAAITSYGRTSKLTDGGLLDKATTLYVIRVMQGGNSWYVARRYSEFRKLHEQLSVLLASNACASCGELAAYYGTVVFPQRFHFPTVSKLKIEESRMHALDDYVRLLMKTTQGLLCDDEDHCGGDHQAACCATTLIREFLLVHAQDDAETEYSSGSEDEGRRQHLAARHQPLKSAKVSSFRMHDLDVLYREKSPCAQTQSKYWQQASGATTTTDLDELFDDFVSPSCDALIHHEMTDAEPRAAALHASLRRAESLGRR